MRKHTKFQRLMLINAYPSKLLLNTIGGIIALFFLWKHQFLAAMLSGGVLILIGAIIATKFSRFGREKIGNTFVGKIFLRYSTPFGFICYLMSHTLIPISFWQHNFYLTGLGLFFLAFGLYNREEKNTPGNDENIEVLDPPAF
jgi:hypothetical protein